jgi:hypothetical protein
MFKRLTSILSKKAGFLSSTRKIQQEADAIRVLVLSEFFRRNLGRTSTNIKSTSISDDVKAYTMDELLDATPVGEVSMREWLSGLSYQEVLSYNQSNLHHQVLQLFRHLHQVHQHVYITANTTNQPIDTAFDAADAYSFSKSTDNTSEMYQMLQELCGFSLHVDTSKVSNIDSTDENDHQLVDGVYIKGKASAGAVIGFFPGVTYLRDRVHAGDFKLRLDERGGKSDYVYMRPDRSLIDGSQRVGLLNSFALGHLIRHPSKFKNSSGCHNSNKKRGDGGRSSSGASLVALPNVMTFPFDYPLEDGKEELSDGIISKIDENSNIDDVSTLRPSNFFPIELRPYIPNAYNTPPGMLSPESSRESFAQGAVIIALNDLEDGDELFCDYRLNPSVPLPKWYCPVDEERSQKYWGG